VKVDVPSQPAVAGAVRIPPIALGPPLDLGFTLVDAQVASSVISGAIVRAFVIPPGTSFPVELASGMTDRSGRVDLYASMPEAFTGTPATSSPPGP
jgi:hypothetical protein